MPSRLKTKKLHERASSIGHFLQMVQSKLLVQVTVGSHRRRYHRSAWALMHGCPAPLFASDVTRTNVKAVIEEPDVLFDLLQTSCSGGLPFASIPNVGSAK